MKWDWVSFIIGLVVGSGFGLFTASLLWAARSGDEREGR